MTGQAGRRGLDTEERGAGFMAELGILVDGNPRRCRQDGPTGRRATVQPPSARATQAGGPRSPLPIQMRPFPIHRQEDAGARSS